MTSSASQHFASFAAYTPPPDDPAATRNQSATRPWFPAHASSSPSPANMSYQAGGIPTFATAQAGPSTGHVEEGLNPSNLWETRFGWRVDVLAAVAYLGGPFTGARGWTECAGADGAQLWRCLYWRRATTMCASTVRAHAARASPRSLPAAAYQSALVSSPLLLLLFLEHLVRLPAFFTVLTTLVIVLSTLYLACVPSWALFRR